MPWRNQPTKNDKTNKNHESNNVNGKADEKENELSPLLLPESIPKLFQRRLTQLSNRAGIGNLQNTDLQAQMSPPPPANLSADQRINTKASYWLCDIEILFGEGQQTGK